MAPEIEVARLLQFNQEGTIVQVNDTTCHVQGLETTTLYFNPFSGRIKDDLQSLRRQNREPLTHHM